MGEVQIAALFCALLADSTPEAPKEFVSLGEDQRVRVDCETPNLVIELGFDNKAASRDSVHQAVFAAILTGKEPMVVVLDTDGVVGRYEFEIRKVAEDLGVQYGVCKYDFYRALGCNRGFQGRRPRQES